MISPFRPLFSSLTSLACHSADELDFNAYLVFREALSRVPSLNRPAVESVVRPMLLSSPALADFLEDYNHISFYAFRPGCLVDRFDAEYAVTVTRDYLAHLNYGHDFEHSLLR